mgnify:CR=1 FL=1
MTSELDSKSKDTVPIPSSLIPGLIMAMVGAVAFSGKAIIVKLAYRHGVDAVTLIMYRMLFALPLFAFIAWWTSRGKPSLSWADRFRVLGLGFSGYYLASYLDFLGLTYISASLERLILYLNPTIVMLLTWILYKRRISKIQMMGVLLSYAGVVLVFGHEMSLQGSDAVLGSGLVFASAVFYSLYLIFSGECVRRLGALRLVGAASTVACLFCISHFLIQRPMSAAIVAPEVISLSVLNAILCTVVPVVLVMMAIERIGAGMTAQTGMLGPISTLIMGVVLLGEPFTIWIAVGTIFVLAGIYVFGQKGKDSFEKKI